MTTDFHVIKDPVHGTMQFTAQEHSWLRYFIDSPDVQRLRNIKQLGLGDLVFPGAVHTRFNHSLGCCFLGGRITKTLELDPTQQQTAMIACLLHDVGHGPFSHAFEDVFYKKTICHEDWTPLFLRDYASDAFMETYNRANPDFLFSQEMLKQIEAIIMHRPSNSLLLSDVVSSQLDADRLDYLLRDSHFCGVRYGEYDLEWMLHCLVSVETHEGKRLGINRKGVGVVEHYLMARRLMMKNIYHHRKKFAIERLLIHLLRLLSSELIVNKSLQDLAKTSIGKFLINLNHFNQLCLNEVSASQKQAFLEDNFDLYRTLCDYDVLSLIKQLSHVSSDDDIYLLAKRLHHRDVPIVIPLTDSQFEHAKQVFDYYQQKLSGLRPWQLELLKLPHRSYTRKDSPIMVTSEQGTKPLEEVSMMIQSMSDRFENGCFVVMDRHLCDESLIQQIVNELLQCDTMNLESLMNQDE